MKEKNADGKEKRPAVGIGVLVVNVHGQILLSKRKKKYGYGKLALPGGHVEWMESLCKTGKREVQEETGLVLEDIQEMRDYTEELNKKEDKHYVTFYLIAALPDGQAPIVPDSEKKKHGPWKWYDPFNLPKDAWEPTKRLCKRSGQQIANFIKKVQGDHLAKYSK